MVMLCCKNHPDLRWCCKAIAWSPSKNPETPRAGHYNGARNIFFFGLRTPEEPMGTQLVRDPSGSLQLVMECKCPASDLELAPEQDPAEARSG